MRDAAGLRDVRAALAEIGYRVAPEGALDPALATVLRAFQRHWRPEAVTGQADAGTLARLLGVQQLIPGAGSNDSLSRRNATLVMPGEGPASTT